MQRALLEISNFRGVHTGRVSFSRHAVLVGPNNSGKTTVIEALALLFGRDRLVRPLTEHDFYGGCPAPADRIKLIATIVGFEANDLTLHPNWFGEARGIAKWFNPIICLTATAASGSPSALIMSIVKRSTPALNCEWHLPH